MMLGKESLRERVYENRFVIASAMAVAFVVMVIVAIFLFQEASYTGSVNERDAQIKKLNTVVGRLEVSYARLRDQDLALNIVPAAPSLGDVLSPNTQTPAILPKQFTAAFPDGIFTCVDRTGDGNYFCTIKITKPPSSTTTTTRPPH